MNRFTWTALVSVLLLGVGLIAYQYRNTLFTDQRSPTAARQSQSNPPPFWNNVQGVWKPTMQRNPVVTLLGPQQLPTPVGVDPQFRTQGGIRTALNEQEDVLHHFSYCSVDDQQHLRFVITIARGQPRKMYILVFGPPGSDTAELYLQELKAMPSTPTQWANPAMTMPTSDFSQRKLIAHLIRTQKYAQ